MYKKYILGFLLFGLVWGASFAADWNLPGITIVSRKQWGADETIRYSTLPKSQRDAIRKEQEARELEQMKASDNESGSGVDNKLWTILQQQYQTQIMNDFIVNTNPSEQTVDEVRESYNGNYLKWPESIHKDKTKIIIHHTAEDYTKLLSGGIDAVKKQLQSIYKYHAVTRGWGDIGYNFIIDPYGNIYEGRAGGDGVVAAHVSYNNTPTVGIALMGNFQIQQPTDDQLKSLIALTTALAKKYGINPTAKATYFKKADLPPYMTTVSSYTIVGHKDASQATACPGTNLYVLLPTIRDHVKQNLANQLLASKLVGSGQTSPSIVSLTGLYYTSTTTVKIQTSLGGTPSCSSLGTGSVVSSCSLQQGTLSLVFKRTGLSSGPKLVKVTGLSGGKQTTLVYDFSLVWKNDLTYMGQQLAQTYMQTNKLVYAPAPVKKIIHKTTLSEVKSYLSGMINVLLYDLTMNYTSWSFACDGLCKITIDGKTSQSSSFTVEAHDTFIYLASGENYYSPQKVEIAPLTGTLVKIVSYPRASYAKVPRNTFHGSLVFKLNPIKNLASGAIENRVVLINRLSFTDYMKGIAETSDTDGLEKQKLVLLLAKMYALFYLHADNKHPSIPVGASYTAIDNPDMFQKYVGAGWESTSKTSALALSAIQNQVVLYSGYLPILPYFSCSAGFTRSAKAKWGRIDTPYLQYRLDFDACLDFKGHGVGLSGKGSQYLAQQGWTLAQILDYYYPGVTLTKLY